MSEAAKPVDVNRETFSSEVLEASYARPVLVDFWASWCGPCQMLAPMLENIAAAYGSEAVVAKVNTDEEHDLAAQYGVRALPTLKLFRDGQLVEEIMGVQPEGNIRAIIDRHLPRASDDARAQARAAREAGDPAGAAELLEQAHRDDPENDALKLELAEASIASGALDHAEAVLRTLPAAVEAEDRAKALHARLEFARAAAEAPEAAALERRIAESPKDLEARYALAARKVAAGEYETAMDQLLAIMQRDRGFGDDAGRRGLLGVFELLGGSGPVVDKYRRKMASALH